MILTINTKDRDKVKFQLMEGRKVVASYEADLPLTQKSDVLRHLEKFLSSQKANSYQLTAISLIIGEGSKTGLRVGSAIAQALSLAWDIPIKKQKSTTWNQ